MNSKKLLIELGVLLSILSLILGCTNGEAATTDSKFPTERINSSNSVAENPGSINDRSTTSSDLLVGFDDRGESGGNLLQVGASDVGIWVTGRGSITLEPDMATVNVGVQVEERTVSQARQEASTAMDSVVKKLKSEGLKDQDIQTTSFNIYPRYDYYEGKQELVGYTVSNMATIKVRDLDRVGEIIDSIADAGGDATRINGINFTVEDTSQFMDELREQAMQQAFDKAQHLADLGGVSLGQLSYVGEAGNVGQVSGGFERAMAMSAPTTSISSGELELSLAINVAFGIR